MPVTDCTAQYASHMTTCQVALCQLQTVLLSMQVNCQYASHMTTYQVAVCQLQTVLSVCKSHDNLLTTVKKQYASHMTA